MASSYAQASQDLFVHSLLGDKGYFLDIGAGWDSYGLNSNSLYLEEQGWTGICIEGDLESANKRKSRSINCKVLNVFVPQKSLKDILTDENSPNIIDYVSIDIEPNSVVALKDFPFETFEFKILTFEHDFYRIGKEQKEEAHQILSSYGYTLLCNDVFGPVDICGENCPYEDWWINPKYFASDFIKNNSFDKQYGRYIVSKLKL